MMGKRRIQVKPGDVIEIPIEDGWLAFARIYEFSGYRPYKLASKQRPVLAEIAASPPLEVLRVGEYQTESGAWTVIGKHPFADGEDRWGPQVIAWGCLDDRQGNRVATPEDYKRFPAAVVYGEDELINFLRKELVGLPPLAPRPPKPVDEHADMSLDHNDVAERVILQFDEFFMDGNSPTKAIHKTIKFFKDDFDDCDYEPHIWLALALLGMKHHCLTEQIRDQALDVIDSGRCWDVVAQVDQEFQPESLKVRKRIIAKFRKELESAELV